jgi:hypothetical protein
MIIDSAKILTVMDKLQHRIMKISRGMNHDSTIVIVEFWTNTDELMKELEFISKRKSRPSNSEYYDVLCVESTMCLLYE